ncbi:MAG: toxin-antitoxin system YwqK family antitoxin [Bacteroidia bacterium]
MSRLVLIGVFSIVFCFQLLSQQKLKEGYNKLYYPNGNISSEGTIKDGKPNGYWKNYYENGKIKIEGNRKNFQLDSTWIFNDIKGRITRSIDYKEGKKNGFIRTYDTLGNKITEDDYKDDIIVGISKKFFPSGKIMKTQPYSGGVKDGTGYEFNEDSLVTAIVNYKKGVFIGKERINEKDNLGRKQGLWKELFENGDVKKEMNYYNDTLVGFAMEYDKKGNLKSIKKYDKGKELKNAPEVRQVQVYRKRYEDGSLAYEGVYDDGVPIGSHYHYKQEYKCDSIEYYNDSIGGFYKKWICRTYSIPDSLIEYDEGVLIAKGAVDKDRNKIGEWVEYHNSGEFKAKGVYVNDKPTGVWKFFYPSGKLEQTGQYDKAGREQKTWIWYYESGKVMREENYYNGKREGLMVDYTENGDVFIKGNWFDDKKEGIWYYENDNYFEKGKFVSGQLDSLWRGFYKPEKSKFFIGKFEYGVAEGHHTFYYRNGVKMVEGDYQGGLKQGDWKFYDETGLNYLSIHYKDDIEIKWQGEKIFPTYEQSVRTYNIKIGEDKTQTIRSKP